jgi:hypothetical protein
MYVSVAMLVGFGKYLLKMLVGRKVEGQVGRQIDVGGE